MSTLKRLAGLLTALAFVFVMSGCETVIAKTSANSTSDTSAESESGLSGSTAVVDLSLSASDTDATYNESDAVKITYSDGSVTAGGSGVTVSGSVATITTGGTYLVSGTCSDGQLIVNAGNKKEVKIVLNDLTLSCSSSSPFIILSADKVTVTLAEGSTNALSDGSDYSVTMDGSTVDGTIFSKADLTFNGTGTLNITGNYKHGIVSKDDLVIADGTINITAASAGMEGKDCLKIAGGTITVESGTDGLRSTNDEDTSRGFVSISGGTINIASGDDGIQAVTLITISGGTVSIVSGNGSASSTKHSNGNMNGPGQTTATTTTTSKAKGIKCEGDIDISGGEITVDSQDDTVNSAATAIVSGGTITLSSGDDAIHADSVLEIRDGTITINKSYEGLESADIEISGGTIYVTSSDDGLNASKGSTTTTGFGGGGGMDQSDGSILRISGGYLVVNASGDGLDSNGDLEVSGGVTLVSGPTDDSNGALDFSGTGTITGGVVIAAGSSGMAQNFSSDSTQGSIMVTVSTQSANTEISLCDASGNVICSFSPMKQYVNVVFSAPSVTTGSTYTVQTGTVSGADKYGYTSSGTVSGGSTLTTVQMTSLQYGSSTGMGGGAGGGMGGGMGGGTQRGTTGGFGGR